MNPQLPPILLTSSVIAMDKTVTLIDPQERIHHTLESIEKWLSMYPDIRLVICDGSGYDFTDTIRQQFPGCSIECLAFENDARMVAYRGKGYGEGEIIKHALQHSQELRAANWFAKCTGKLWVDNFERCVREWNGALLCKAFFAHVFERKPIKLEYIDTRFYLTTIDIYRRHFIDAHQSVGGESSDSIEDVFRKIILANQMQGVLFKTPPVIRGVGGGSGKYYRNNFVRRVKETLRARLVQRNPAFRDLFKHPGQAS
jgi:hypothetical protein